LAIGEFIVIQQYPITTAPKYNFACSPIEKPLPQHFLEQSILSLRQAQSQHFQLNQQNIQQSSNIEANMQSFQLKLQPLALTPIRHETAIASCDTSTIKIGETTTGILIAVRGASVIKQNKHYTYTRFGPFIFHITEENKRDLHTSLEQAYFGSHNEKSQNYYANLLQMPTRIASILERWLQTSLARTMSNGIILFDGSLTAGTSETPTHRLKQILNYANERANVVLAFSKMTTLRINGYLITDVPLGHKPPFMLETAGLKPKPPIVLLGDVYVARFTCGNIAFRLDISREQPTEQKIEAVNRLLGNDVISESYPETLRLAHILCTFTANEVIAMQHYSTRRYGVRIINRPDMHRLLFGPFGKGEYFS
jgi:hypothetical protein